MMDSSALDGNTAVGRAGRGAQLARVAGNLTGRSPCNVRMAMARAWSRLLALDVQDALASVCAVEPCLRGLDAETATCLRAEIGAFRAVGFALRDDCIAALPLALASLEGVAAPAVTLLATTLARLAYWKLGDFERFHALRRGQRPILEKRHTSLVAFDGAVEAAVELQQLRFGLAGRLAQDAMALVPRQGVRAFPISPLPTVVLAQVLYEQGALSEVEALARDRLPLVTVRASPETAVRVYPLLARIAAHRRQVGLALFLLGEGEALGEVHGWGRLTAACLQQRVELLVRARRIEEARTSLERMRPLLNAANRSHYNGAAIHGYFELARSRIELACAPTLEIVARVRHLHHEAAASGDLYLAVRLAICLAEALGALDEEGAAHETLSRSLELGASVGLHQCFVDGGPVIGRLLVLAAERERRFLQPYVGSLLNSWRSAHESAGALKISKLSGPLSARECAILGLVRRGYSNKRIALELRIAPETVKSHAKHIFLKLGARTRVEAVSRAASLGLI
jgi:ATP/maltotriose-dependent transcriptional regulator MalT